MTASHSPARINPDTRHALSIAMLGTALIVSISFTLSFAGLSAIAPWAAVPDSLAWLVPLFVDGAILVYTYSAFAARARGESTVRPWTWVVLWTVVSSATNAAHAWSFGPQGWEGIVGAIFAGLFPIGSLLGTHEIADRMIARPGLDALDTPVPAPVQPAGRAIQAELVPMAPAIVTVLDRDTEILRLSRTEGLSVRAIATRLGVGKTTVHNVLTAHGEPA